LPIFGTLAVLVALVSSLPRTQPAGAQTPGSRPSSPGLVRPAVAEWEFLQSSVTPPSEAACNAVGRRCFTPASMQNSYNLPPLLATGNQGQGRTIAIIDSFGSATIANDLAVFNTVMGLPHMCGEPGFPCTPATPKFSVLQVQGSPQPNPPPPNNGTGLENH